MPGPPLSRAMECSWCGHDEHLLRCEALIVPGVPVPGIWHPDGPANPQQGNAKP